MTLKEYFDQTDPIRQLVGSVVLQREEVTVFSQHTLGKQVYIDRPELLGVEYFVKKGEALLWTTDSDGNPVSRTVFKLWQPI